MPTPWHTTICRPWTTTICGAASPPVTGPSTRPRPFLAFQIRDDILDVEGNAEDLGKQPGVDQARGKATYPALLGLEEARAEADSLYREALDSLEPLGEDADLLRWIGRYIVERQH